MTYLVINKNNRVIKQFNDYQKAWDYCREESNKRFIRLICLNTTTFKNEEIITF